MDGLSRHLAKGNMGTKEHRAPNVVNSFLSHPHSAHYGLAEIFYEIRRLIVDRGYSRIQVSQLIFLLVACLEC